MAVLRLRRCGIAVVVSFLLAACSGSTESTDSPTEALSLSGSVGDGPVVDADIVVTDAGGEVLDEGVSDALATYDISLPADTALPVLVSATGGTDLVTGRGLDFTLLGAALETGTLTVNVSPLTTLAVRAAQCSAEGLTEDSLAQAWERIHDQLSMGLDAGLVPDAMSTPVTEANAEAVVLANEALGEAVRRTVQALSGAGSQAEADDILVQVGCAVMDRVLDASGEPLDPSLVATFKAAELTTRLEALAGRLEVDGSPATGRMNDAIRLVLPDFADPDVATVPVNESARGQALALISLFRELADSDALVTLAGALQQASPADVPAAVDGGLTASLHADLLAMTTNLAFADDGALAELEARRSAQQTASRPLLSVSADPGQVAPGGSATLSWASSNAEQCVSSWDGAVALEGAADSGSLESSTRFELSCVGLGGAVSDSAVVLVGDDPEPTPEPTLTLSASATEVTPGAGTRLTWNSSNADSCTASGGWSGSVAVSGSRDVGPLSETTSYGLSCSGDGGSVSRSVTVQVADDPDPTPQPTVTLQASDSRVDQGDSVTLSWSSSHADACTSSGGWSGGRAVNGSRTMGPLSATTTYELTCSGDGGSASDSVTIEVNAPQAPSVNLTVSDSDVDSGDSVTLSWSSSNADSCTASGGWGGGKGTSGSQSVGPLSSTTSYQLSCSGAGGSAQDSVTVDVAAGPEPTVDLQASETVVDSGDSVVLSWTSTDADDCSASGGWSGDKPTSGSESSDALDQQTTFSLTCSGNGDSAMSMISVAVNGTVVLSWEPPTENVDGSELDDLDGYRIYWGQLSGNYTDSLAIDASGTDHSVDLPSGTYYFAMTALDTDGNESAHSNEVQKTVD